MRIGLSEHFTLKKLLIFVLPSVVMMLFTSVYSVVDGLFVSNFAGETAVAAINLIFPLFMIFGSIGFMIGAGGSALVSKTLGEGDKERANKYFSMLVYITAGIGVFIAVAGQFAVEPVAKLLGAKEDPILGYCVLYGRILLGTQPFFILRHCGKTASWAHCHRVGGSFEYNFRRSVRCRVRVGTYRRRRGDRG